MRADPLLPTHDGIPLGIHFVCLWTGKLNEFWRKPIKLRNYREYYCGNAIPRDPIGECPCVSRTPTLRVRISLGKTKDETICWPHDNLILGICYVKFQDSVIVSRSGSKEDIVGADYHGISTI